MVLCDYTSAESWKAARRKGALVCVGVNPDAIESGCNCWNAEQGCDLQDLMAMWDVMFC